MEIGDVRFLNWEAVRVSNGLVEVIVVPSIGRIMAYGFCGEKNLLWHQPQLEGQALDKSALKSNQIPEWANFGGDKVWPTEQSQFPMINGFEWPPDPYFDGLPHQVEILDKGIRMTSEVSPFCGAQLVRTITIHPEKTQIDIDQTMIKVRQGRHSELEPIPLTLWNVTQIHVPDLILFPVSETSHLDGGVYIFPLDNRTEKQLSVTKQTGSLKPSKAFHQKIGTDGENWLAALCGDTAIVERFQPVSGIRPDGNLTTEVYACPDYVELELLSPLHRLKVGESFSYPISWDLLKLPELAAPEDRQKRVLAWARQSKM